jgi:hypothetical protein
MQILGSWANGERLWAWANTASNPPAEAIQAALRLKARGEAAGSRELTMPRLNLTREQFHNLLTVSCGFERADTYFGGDYGRGVAGMLVYDAPIAATEQIRSFEILRALARLPFNDLGLSHREATKWFLLKIGVTVIERENAMAIADPDGRQYQIVFDAQGRLQTHGGLWSLVRRAVVDWCAVLGW